MRTSSHSLHACEVLAAAVLIACAGLRELWGPDELRDAMVARWCFEHDEFMILRRCGGPHPCKPPFLLWRAGQLGWLRRCSAFAMHPVSSSQRAGHSGRSSASRIAVLPLLSKAGAASPIEPARFEPPFFGQHLKRAIEDSEHRGSPRKCVLELLLDLLPWSAPFVLDALRVWRARRRAGRTLR